MYIWSVPTPKIHEQHETTCHPFFTAGNQTRTDPQQRISSTENPHHYMSTPTHPHARKKTETYKNNMSEMYYRYTQARHTHLLNIPATTLPTAALSTLICMGITPEVHVNIRIHYLKYHSIYSWHVYIPTGGFAWLIRWFSFDLLIEFIGPLYHLYNSSEITDRLSSSSDWTLHGNYSDFQLNWTPLFRCTLSYSFLFLTVPSYNFLARTPRKTPYSVVKNACLLVRYLAVGVLFLRP
jgi:hypothetical protein